MAGSIIGTMKARRKRRSASDALEAAIEGRGGRKAAPRARPKPKPKRKARAKAVARRREPTRAQAVPSVSVDNSAAIADVERRMKEIMASSTTPDRR